MIYLVFQAPFLLCTSSPITPTSYQKLTQAFENCASWMEFKSLPVTLSSDVLEEEEFTPIGRFSFFHRRYWKQFSCYSKGKPSYSGSCWLLSVSTSRTSYSQASLSLSALPWVRVAEVGCLSAIKIPVKRVFAIFATNASFLRVITNLQIQLSIMSNTYHVIVHFMPKKHCFNPKEALFRTRISKKLLNHNKFLYHNKKAYVRD